MAHRAIPDFFPHEIMYLYVYVTYGMHCIYIAK